MLDDINILDQKISNNLPFYVTLKFKKEKYYKKTLEILKSYSQREYFHNNKYFIDIEGQENNTLNEKEINFKVLTLGENSYYKIKDFFESILYQKIKKDNKIKIDYIHIKNQLLFGEKNILNLFKLNSNNIIFISLIIFIIFCILGFILIYLNLIKVGWIEITFSMFFSTILTITSIYSSISNKIEGKLK